MNAVAELVRVDEDASPSQFRRAAERLSLAPAHETSEPPRVSASAAVPVIYPLSRLAARRLKRTLVVSVEQDGSDVVMSNPRLRVWGVGSDVYEALADFSNTFEDVLRSYSQTPAAEMTDGASEYLAVLRTYID